MTDEERRLIGLLEGAKLSKFATLVKQYTHKWGATPFDGFVDKAQNVLQESVDTVKDDDKIVYLKVNGVFAYMQKGDSAGGLGSTSNIKYFANWPTRGLYVNDGLTYTDRFFVSESGYITNGKVVDFDSISSVEIAIEQLRNDLNNYVTKTAFDALAKEVANCATLEELGDVEHAFTTAMNNLDERSKYNVVLDGEVTFDKGQYVVPNEENVGKTFLIKTTDLSGNVTSTKIAEVVKEGGVPKYKNITPDKTKVYVVGDKAYIADTDGATVRPVGTPTTVDKAYDKNSNNAIANKVVAADSENIHNDLDAIHSELEDVDDLISGLRTGKVDKTDVETELKLNSSNPVANSAVTKAINDVQGNIIDLDDNKVDKKDVDTALNENSNNPIANSAVKEAYDGLYNAIFELDEKIDSNFETLNSSGLKRQIVDSLPQKSDYADGNIPENIIFMLPVRSEVGDYYDEYMWVEAKGTYEKIGTSRTSLEGYTKDEEQNRLIASTIGLDISNPFENNWQSFKINLYENDIVKVVQASGTQLPFEVIIPGMSYLHITDHAEHTVQYSTTAIQVLHTINAKLFIVNNAVTNVGLPHLTDNDVETIFNEAQIY